MIYFYSYFIVCGLILVMIYFNCITIFKFNNLLIKFTINISMQLMQMETSNKEKQSNQVNTNLYPNHNIFD
jgi:hypothetical protein